MKRNITFAVVSAAFAVAIVSYETLEMGFMGAMGFDPYAESNYVHDNTILEDYQVWGTRGYLKNVAVDNVQDYEAKLLHHLRTDQTALLSQIATEKKLTDEIEAKIKDVLDAFTKSYTAG